MASSRGDVAVVVPSVRPSFARLEEDLSRQGITPAVVEVVHGVRPSGRARNEGVRRTLARFPTVRTVVFLDDDARARDPGLLGKLLAPLDRDATGRVGVSGAAKVLARDATPFERRVAREVPRVVEPPVPRDLESPASARGYRFSAVTTTCCAIRREALEAVGGFREDIARGVDTELFARLAARGFRFVLAAGAAVEHPAPRDLGELLARFRELGCGHAHEAALDPSRGIGLPVRGLGSAAAYLLARALLLPASVLVPYSRAHPVLELDVRPLKALASFAAAYGYVEGALAAARGEPA